MRAPIRLRSVSRWFALLVAVIVAVPGCDIFKKYGDWVASNEPPPPICMGGGGGAGGDTGVGGDGGAGGDYGAGGDPSSGPGTTDVGVGVGAGGADVGAGAGPGARSAPRHASGRRRHGRLGTARQAYCVPPDGTTPAPMMAPIPSPWIPLTTDRLRTIATAQGIGAGLSGIQFNRAVGLAFENWVLTTMGQRDKRNTTSFFSLRRKNKNNGGLPASVIPEFVEQLNLLVIPWSGEPFPDSQFYEVKAVTADIMLSTSRWQILGLIDVASQSLAGVSTTPKHPPPVVIFTTTATHIASDVIQQASQLGVAIWQQIVFEDLQSSATNPILSIGQRVPVNPDVYGTAAVEPNPPHYPNSTLTSPTAPPIVVPNDPDPPEVD